MREYIYIVTEYWADMEVSDVEPWQVVYTSWDETVENIKEYIVESAWDNREDDMPLFGDEIPPEFRANVLKHVVADGGVAGGIVNPDGSQEIMWSYFDVTRAVVVSKNKE